ncbi:MAG: preprotein translocase subunit YajC [Porticoccaceae bacterium]|nr:preprotein translocase subunit YajC [Porticoccaceae bacterium]
MFFISSAFAQSAGAGEPNPMVTLFMFAGLFVFMYFLIIRPQRKRQKEHTDLIGALGKGDEVVMTSGMLGKITKLEGDYVVLEVTNNLELKFQKAAVHAVLPKGTIKAI